MLHDHVIISIHGLITHGVHNNAYAGYIVPCHHYIAYYIIFMYTYVWGAHTNHRGGVLVRADGDVSHRPYSFGAEKQAILHEFVQSVCVHGHLPATPDRRLAPRPPQEAAAWRPQEKVV